MNLLRCIQHGIQNQEMSLLPANRISINMLIFTQKLINLKRDELLTL